MDEKTEIEKAVLAILEREKTLSTEEQERKKKNQDFVMIFDGALNSALQLVASQSGQAIRLFMFLASHMDRAGAIAIGNELMAEALDIESRNVPRLLKILRDHGVIFTVRGTQSIHCMNPQVAWRSSATGKDYAMFNVMAVTDKAEYLAARADAVRRSEAARLSIEDRLKRVGMLVKKPLPFAQPTLPMMEEPAPATKPKKGPGLKIKRPTRKTASQPA